MFVFRAFYYSIVSRDGSYFFRRCYAFLAVRRSQNSPEDCRFDAVFVIGLVILQNRTRVKPRVTREGLCPSESTNKVTASIRHSKKTAAHLKYGRIFSPLSKVTHLELLVSRAGYNRDAFRIISLSPCILNSYLYTTFSHYHEQQLPTLGARDMCECAFFLLTDISLDYIILPFVSGIVNKNKHFFFLHQKDTAVYMQINPQKLSIFFPLPTSHIYVIFYKIICCYGILKI